MAIMVVFDKKTCIDNPMPGIGSKGSFIGMLCHSPRPFHVNRKRFIEGTFPCLPDGEEKNELLKRLRTEEQFEGAFFELLIFHMLDMLDLKSEFQPKSLNCRPDFLVEPDNYSNFIIDTISFRPRHDIKEYNNRRQLLDEKIIRYVEQAYSFYLVGHTDFPCSFDAGNAKIWALAINKELKKLSHSKISSQVIKVPISGSTEFIKLRVFMSEDGNPHYLIGLKKIIAGSDSGRIRVELRQKVKEQYKQCDFPIVMVVGASQSSLIELDTVFYALYGDPVLRWGIETTESEAIQNDAGLFLHASYDSETRKKISAVVCVLRSNSAQIGQNLYDVNIFHNPYATVKLGPAIFGRFPQVAFNNVTGEEKRIGDTRVKMTIDPL